MNKQPAKNSQQKKGGGASTSPPPENTNSNTSINSNEDEEYCSDSSSQGNSDNEESEKFRNLKLRRTDSISKYKAKQLLKLQQQQLEEEQQQQEDENTEEDNKDDDSSSKTILNGTYTPPPSHLVTPFQNSTPSASSGGGVNGDNATTSPPVDGTMANGGSSPMSEEKRNVPLIVIPPSTIQEEVKKKRQSLDSDDEDFGYEDNLQFTVVSKKNSPRTENLKPINNPIPKRPIFQVDPSKEIINLSLIALRTTIRIGFDKIDTLTQNDFIHFKKYRVAISEKRTIIKDFSPNVFHILRNRLNIDQTEFLKSWSSFINLNEDKKLKGSSGSSDFLVYSSDKRYIMKIINKSDSVKLRTLLPHYYNYLIYNPNSLLEKYLGLFRIGNKSNHSYVVILSNLYETNITTNQQFSQTGQNISSTSIKKGNFKKFLNLDKFTKQTLYQQIEKDVTFLSSQDLIDYSLVVGVVNNKSQINEIEKEIRVDNIDLSPLSNTPSTPPPQLRSQSSDESNSNNNNNNMNGNKPEVQKQDNINISLSSSSTATITPPSSPKSGSGANSSELGSPSNSMRSSSSNITFVDPIKTVPRLLYFIEDVEIVIKSNNLKISKSLKKSFAALPRSWSLEDINTSISSSSSMDTIPGTPQQQHQQQPSQSQPTTPIQHLQVKTNHGLLSSSTPATSNLVSSMELGVDINPLKTSTPSSPSPSTHHLSTSPLSSSPISNSSISSKSPTTTTTTTTVLKSNLQKYKKVSYQSIDEPQEIYYFGIQDILSKQKSLASLGKQSLSPNANQYLKKFISNIKESFFNLTSPVPSSPIIGTSK
ncbi:phosphatidylinositol-4-phosphate 5-kinase (PIP5K) family protein [Tieghemostelium lacteum]|uniref:Phosphatidylinositol-4-phosphate 5-kinase (PIP5K) family protein n=1 Tax=Tieghemostelium lacteum TaxID=361077 RepID=A0A152A593_TIELA|nr:phosphatidylinositol-4-phosphate 5-kinase (PIP5K) family protein [Tieghemostelium lacteum]|eukprot:KYR01394.1 phosphatidylinositol-4-phosphate 5-kinase (PIP5K) family protein [Tieghemostelium lacteum]